jgi:hypothetical protein
MNTTISNYLLLAAIGAGRSVCHFGGDGGVGHETLLDDFTGPGKSSVEEL